MAEQSVSPRQLRAGVSVRTGAFHAFRLEPRPHLGRVFGQAFETNRSFLLPGAARRMVRVRELLTRRNPTHLLIVGHCDTTGEDAINDPLSLERAQTTLAFVQDDKGFWLGRYDDATPKARRWGRDEDLAMIGAVSGFADREPGEDPVRWFQRTRGLSVDGDAGPETRGALVAEYMALDGPPFAELGLQADFTAHGCGEHFPLDEGGRHLDLPAPDGKADAMDRRVEFFFFPRTTGVQPAPPGPNSAKADPQYLEWRRLSRVEFETVVVEGEEDFFVRLHVDPASQADLTESLRLFSTGGEYDETRTATADGQAGEGFIDVLFTRVLTKLSYSLEVAPAGASVYRLFENQPFEALNGLHEPPTPFDDPDPLEPEPNLDA